MNRNEGREMAMRSWQTTPGGTDDSSEEGEDDEEEERRTEGQGQGRGGGGGGVTGTQKAAPLQMW